MEFLDFELEIGSSDSQHYPVSVIRSPAGEASGTFAFPFEPLVLESALKDIQIALLASGSTRQRRVTPDFEIPVQQFGRALFEALFAGPIGTQWEVSRSRAKEHEQGLRLKLRFESAELAGLPWEFLYDDRRAEYVCLSRRTPLIRYLELPESVPPLRIEPPLRVLGMISSPHDLVPLDVENEKARIDDATRGLVDAGLLKIHWLERATTRELQRALRVDSWHVFHFIGHGGFSAEAGEGVLALADESGAQDLLPATHLGRLLGDLPSLRLAVLNACEGARTNQSDVFSSTAAALVRHGVPAVVAMQYPVTDTAAIELSRSFYEALADGLPVDTSLTEARKSVSFALKGSVEWGTPVLYMRSPDGVLFDVAGGGIKPYPPKAPDHPPPTPPDERKKQEAPATPDRIRGTVAGKSGKGWAIAAVAAAIGIVLLALISMGVFAGTSRSYDAGYAEGVEEACSDGDDNVPLRADTDYAHGYDDAVGDIRNGSRSCPPR